jgi:diaminohydroxyphosphoribosylaminopyrimidine deaminase/5-amino-6-(5-phosphoribosylamino)uracil reductase
MPPAARLFSTLSAGPVIIVTSGEALSRLPAQREALERAGATIVVPEQPGIGAALRALSAFEIQSILLEGGAAVHAAACDEDVVDYVQLFVAPAALGPAGVRLFDGYDVALSSLIDPKIEVLGPDTLIEGYVHRPH